MNKRFKKNHKSIYCLEMQNFPLLTRPVCVTCLHTPDTHVSVYLRHCMDPEVHAENI